jgi:small subunit ribosomal protein S9
MADETPETTPADEPESTPVEETPQAAAEEATTAADESVTTGGESAAGESTKETAPAEPVSLAEEPVAEAEGEPVAEAEVALIDEAASQLTLGSEEVVESAEDQQPQAPLVIRGRVDRFGVAMGTGRRKSSVARVRIKEGDGKLSINGRSLDEYFCVERDRRMVEAPLLATEQLGKVDVWVRVGGGGTTGQTGAILLGIARALQVMDPSLHHALAGGGYLTRDGRMVERKKYGRKKARKSFQFSKR